MSDTDEQKICQTCSDFEPQTWRKSLCKNCFHTLEEHSAEMLAHEAEVVAKEKLSARVTEATSVSLEQKQEMNQKDTSITASKDVKSKTDIKNASSDKDTTGNAKHNKYGTERVSEKDGNWSWAKDLGREFSKPPKAAPQDTVSSTKGTSLESSKKSPPQTSTKPNFKLTSTSDSSPSSTTSSMTAATDTTTLSKAKCFASKFESKASALSKPKTSAAPRDIRPGTSNILALTGKLADSSGDSKPSSKLSSDKLSQPQKFATSKSDSKFSVNISDDHECSETVSKSLKNAPTKSKDDRVIENNKDSKFCGDVGKDKKSVLSVSKIDEKTSKFSVGNYGKDHLRSAKDLGKNESSVKESLETKMGSSQIKKKENVKSKDILRSPVVEKDKSSSQKSVTEESREEMKETENVLETKMKTADVGQIIPCTDIGLAGKALSSTHGSQIAEHSDLKNSSGQLAKNSGSGAAVTPSEISESKDKIEPTKHITVAVSKCQNTEVATSSAAETKDTDTGKLPVNVNREGDTQVHEGELKDDITNHSSSPLLDREVIPSLPISTTSKATTPTSPADSSELLLSTTITTSDKKLNESQTTSEAISTSPENSQEAKEAFIKADGKESSSSFIKSPRSSPSLESAKKDEYDNNTSEEAKEKTPVDVKNNGERLQNELKEKDYQLSVKTKQLSKMEEQARALQEERDQLKKASLQIQKDEMEHMMNDLRAHLSKMEEQCLKLEKDNQLLIDKLHVQEASVKIVHESMGKTSENDVLEEDLEAAEKELEEVKEENKELQRHVMEMKNEMDEMYDHFRENEHDEFRELQKELDITAKNCRILQFKLRKAERRNDLIEQDRQQYEEKLRMLQDQFDSQDAKNHIRVLEDELRMAKEVSVRLHDELDIVEDKRNKALEENRHLTELLEHTDKRQFRLEMEIDKLRDMVVDLKQQLKEAKGGNNNKETTPDRKPPLAAVGKQGSREYDVSQLMKDLYDSMERENDLKDQLKFTEEEAKMMRRRVSEMDEENENLRLQLQKMSEKASKHKKKEKERLKELREERNKSEAIRAALSTQNSQDDEKGEVSTDVILIVGPEGSDVITYDEPIPINQRKDSTDEDLMNVMQMRVHLEMLDQELMTSHKKLDEMDLENENLQAEVKFLQERLAEKEASVTLPEPSTPNAYYEDKLRELTQESDELRWKLIEKDRELERLSVTQTRHSRGDHSHKKGEKLKKSKSLEDTDITQADLRKQLDHLQMDVIRLKKTVEELTELNEELRAENENLKNKTPIPSVLADDAALENIELKENIRKMEEINRVQIEKIKSLTENLQKLARDPRTYTSIATSPTVPGTLNIPGIPLIGPGSQITRAGVELPNPRDDSNTRDLVARLHALQRENEDLRKLMVETRSAGTEHGDSTLQGRVGGSTQKSTNPSACKSESKKEGAVNTSGTFTERETDKNNFDNEIYIRVDRTNLTTQETTQLFGSVQFRMNSEKTSSKTASTGGAENTAKETEDEEKERTSRTKDEPGRSILLDYPEGKSKVVISGSESRIELMEKVLEMDEEIGDLLSALRKREDENERLRREIKSFTSQMRQVKEESRRTELDLLQELDMLHDKNSVMSNLLDIINDRAEAAEEELERRMQDDTTHSPARSNSNVSQVSALSDTSMGSDEVFLTAHVTKEGVITRDWETKLKVRIESLERLLAEERQKVSMAEKKLMLAGVDSISPSLSDDVKLRMREKELLQEELLKSQRHLHIATDQIQGLRQRILILEDEHERLKTDYAKLYDEIDRPVDKEDRLDKNSSESEKSSHNKIHETPFVAKKISFAESPGLTEEKDGKQEEITKLEEELQKYKQKAKELKYRVEEIDDIWRSKSAATDKERDELDKQVNDKIKEIAMLEQIIEDLRKDVAAKEKIINERNTTLKEKDKELSRLGGLIEEREAERKKRDQELQNFSTQLSQRDSTIRGLNDTIRIRDERLKEKDDILFKLNTSIEEQTRELRNLSEKLNRLSVQLREKEIEISNLRSQISSPPMMSREMPRGCQTDAEKESFRLKEMVKKLQGELDRVVGDKQVLETSLEKSRKSLDEAMQMWDKDRHSLQRDANILEEKVRLYEAFNSMNKDETIETLKVELQGYFSEKEALVCEISSVKLKHEADERAHKELVAKLQAELTEKLRLLKSEVDNSSHMTTEMNRLKRQAEMAYRLQQEQRVFKAEHLAMKVRYETRIDKMSKEQNKMLLTIEKLQKEREMDKQIIDGIQKTLGVVKDSYTDELLRSQEDKATLHRYVKEIEESRAYLEELQKLIRDLKDKTTDQERLRAELINKFATDRTTWEIDRANLNSQINQLEEKIFSSSRQQERSKSIQVNMGMAWDKERREQRRLLTEAHSLALDLQEQLRSRDETFAHERKELVRQMESDRATWAKEKRETERRFLELESANRKLTALEKRLGEFQVKANKEAELWQKEKAEVSHLAAEARHTHASEMKKVEYVLSKLIRLRELGTMLTSQPGWDSLEDKPPDSPENVQQSIIDYVNEAVHQVNQVSDELTNLTNPTSDELPIKRIYSSDVDLLKDEFSLLHRETEDVIVIADITTSSTSTTTRIQEESAGLSRRIHNDVSTQLPNQPSTGGISEVVTKTAGHSVYSVPTRKSESKDTKIIPSPSTTQSSTVLHPSTALSRYSDHSPSYASGTRSAQTSRATTPEAPDISRGLYSSSLRKPGFPDSSPNSIIPNNKFNQTQKPSSISYEQTSSSPKRPVSFMKSLSVDSGSVHDSDASQNRAASQLTSISATNTPTQLVTSADMISSFSTPSVTTTAVDRLLAVSRDFSPGSTQGDKFSPRTARRKFFENYPSSSLSSPNPVGYQSWPDRKGVTTVLHVRQTSLPDPEEVRREAEEEHDLVSSKLQSLGKHSTMKSSTSWDEQMHSKERTEKERRIPTEAVQTPTSPLDEHQIGSKHHSAKEKRKLFKKATSLDSTVGSSIAKVGVAAMPLGAPTGFTPSELFAAVKGKLKPAFKKKQGESGTKTLEPRSPSPLFIQTDVPDIHFVGQGTAQLPVPAPHVDVARLEATTQAEQEFARDVSDERSRDSYRKDVPRGKWRSKSADRVQPPSTLHTDVIRNTAGVWQFNETAV